jgi:hypothetical protein
MHQLGRGADQPAATKTAQIGHRPRRHGDRTLGPARCDGVAQGGTGLSERLGEQLDRLAADRRLDPWHQRVVQAQIDHVPRDIQFGAGHLLQSGGDVLPHLGTRKRQGVAPIAPSDPPQRRLGIGIGALRDHRDLAPDTGADTDQRHQSAAGGPQEGAPLHAPASAARAIAARMRP